MRPRVVLPIIVAIGAALVTGCDPSSGSETADAQPRAVRTEPVRVAEGIREIRLSGVSRAVRRATLSFLVSGTLAERPVELGQVVKAGELLVRLFNPGLEPAVASGEARVRELDARLEQLARDVLRAEDLHGRGLISQEEVERVRTEQAATIASRDLAKANLLEAHNQLAQARIVAPFDGAIDTIHFQLGEFIAAGQPVLALSGAGGLEIELEIPESLIASFERGREVSLAFPFLGNRIVAGTVVHVGDAGGRSGGLFPVEIRMPGEPGLRPGMTAELVLRMSGESGLIVPLAAVLDPGTGRPRVFRVADGRIEPVFVTIGQLSGNLVQVSGPLSAGDRVVVTGVSSLTPGQRVEELR